jgi:hypothetical protein
MASQFEMDWGTIKEPGSGGNVDFMKLVSGANVVRIVGRPSLIELHWEKAADGSTKKVVCPGAGCPICKAGHAPMSRYQVKVIDRGEKDEIKVKVLEGGPTIFNSIKAFAMEPEYGDPTKYDVKIKKDGSGRETKYTVVASPKKTDLTPEEVKAVETSKTLEEINKPKTIEEIQTMGLEILMSSVGDLGNADVGPDEISDDDWNNL